MTCRQAGIDRVVITDHNTIQGALDAWQIEPERVIVGEEIMTRQGELLAIFVQETVPGDLSALQTIQLLRDQGAFISVSHPFDRMRRGQWLDADLAMITPLIDAIEIFNARCLLPGFNNRAKRYAANHGLPGTVGSDAHTPSEIGGVYMRLPPFGDAASLKQVIHQGQLQATLSNPWVHFFSSLAKRKKNTQRNETTH